MSKITNRTTAEELVTEAIEQMTLTGRPSVALDLAYDDGRSIGVTMIVDQVDGVPLRRRMETVH